MIFLKRLIFLLSITFPFSCLAQLELVPIFRDPIPDINKSARVQAPDALTLPFWDDFSFIDSKYFPDQKLWVNSQSVWVNSGMGINPPSLNVATFDGYDSLGKPYSVNDIFAKGYADKLTSLPIRLDLVAPAQQATVFLSFFYQFQGNGEAPDAGDILSLSFKDDKGVWNKVWQREIDATITKDQFIQVLIPVTGIAYFHKTFQFRFQNFGRLSGPYDTWNIDYVYLNKGRSSFDNSYPDRAITTSLTSLFKEYTSIPIKHLLRHPDSLSNPSFNIYNLRIGNQQPINHSSSVKILSYKKNIRIDSTFQSLDNGVGDGSILGLQPKTISLITLPSFPAAAAKADKILIKMKVSLSTKDNLLIDGDYDPAIYSPIDFRKNDTLYSTYTLDSLYAYDDGSAEYGARISGQGTQLAYEFNMKTTSPDTLVAIDLYFPRFGDETSQTIQLHILGGLTGNQSDYLFQKQITIQRNQRNKFWRVTIDRGIVVKEKFYVGWQSLSSAVIPIGLDKNTDSGSKMFVNTAGTWEQNLLIKGSLMIRPIFGTPLNSITSVVDNSVNKPFPNPTTGTFFLPKNASSIYVYDLTGREISHEINADYEHTNVTLTNPASGLYIVRYFNQTWHAEKIIVKP